MAAAVEQFVSPECKACGHQANKLFETHNQHGRISTINNFRCPQCGMVFVGNRPTNEELGEAYGTLDHQQYYAEIRETNAAKMRECVLELAQIVSSDAKILDVGCGNGEFLLLLKANGFRHLAGHEIPGADLSALTRAGIRIWQDYDYETLPDNSFDCVTMLDVAD